MAIKRKAESPAAGLAKRHRQCKVVEEAVLAANNFPAKVLEMVSGNLTDCLGVPKEERHPTQETVVGMVGEILTSVQDAFQQRIDAAEAKLSSATDTKASREQATETNAAAVTTKEEALAAAKAAAGDSVQAIKTAKAALSAAEAEQVNGDKELVEASDKETKLEEARRESYTPLKEGVVPVDRQMKVIAAVVALGKEFQLDSSMLTSLPSALGKAPSDRGSFDAMVFDTLGDELNKRIKNLQETLANGEPAKALRRTKVDEAKRDFDSKEANAESCKNNVENSKTELEAAKTSHKASASALSLFWPEMRQVEKDLASAKAKLAAFTEGALTSYEDLLKSTSLPVPATAAAGSEPAMTQ